MVSTPNALNDTVDADDEIINHFSVAVIVAPIVKNTESLAPTVAPYTRCSARVGVADAVLTDSRYVAAVDAVLHTAIVEITVVVDVGTAYNTE